MAKDSKSTGGTAVEVVARRVRSLNDEILEAARRGGEASPAAARSSSGCRGWSEPDLSKVDSYERKHQNRKTIHDKIASLRD